MNRPIACCLTTAIAILLLPALTSATPKVGEKSNGFNLVEERYLHEYVRCWDAFKARCGRNIVDDNLSSGEAPSQGRVQQSIETMDRWLNPPAPAIDSPTISTPAPAPTTVAPSSGAPVDINCESGGDYSINTGNGYYGAYQFDSGTWDAYGDPAYGEANEAPPAVQDAAAAAVPYDAWPNC
jgi:transglycosylase-like protein